MRGSRLTETEGPAKATSPVSDKPGTRTQASGPFQWPRGSREGPSKLRGAGGDGRRWGYLCRDRNKALQRQSCNCSSKKAQEREEWSEKNKRELEKKKKAESNQDPTHSDTGSNILRVTI